jgi:hypothetical protein
LCSFMVPCRRGAVGFMFLYFHLSVGLIVYILQLVQIL